MMLRILKRLRAPSSFTITYGLIIAALVAGYSFLTVDNLTPRDVVTLLLLNPLIFIALGAFWTEHAPDTLALRVTAYVAARPRAHAHLVVVGTLSALVTVASVYGLSRLMAILQLPSSSESAFYAVVGFAHLILMLSPFVWVPYLALWLLTHNPQRAR